MKILVYFEIFYLYLNKDKMDLFILPVQNIIKEYARDLILGVKIKNNKLTITDIQTKKVYYKVALYDQRKVNTHFFPDYQRIFININGVIPYILSLLINEKSRHIKMDDFAGDHTIANQRYLYDDHDNRLDIVTSKIESLDFTGYNAREIDHILKIESKLDTLIDDFDIISSNNKMMVINRECKLFLFNQKELIHLANYVGNNIRGVINDKYLFINVDRERCYRYDIINEKWYEIPLLILPLSIFDDLLYGYIKQDNKYNLASFDTETLKYNISDTSTDTGIGNIIVTNSTDRLVLFDKQNNKVYNITKYELSIIITNEQYENVGIF